MTISQDDLQDLPANAPAGITNGQLFDIIAAASARARKQAVASRIELENLPNHAVVSAAEVCILMQKEPDTLNHMRNRGDPPPFIRGRPVKYIVGDVRAAILGNRVNSTSEVSVFGTLRVSRLMETYPVFTFPSAENLGYEAAVAHQEQHDEETYASVEVLCLGEFKYMQLGQQLVESPLPAITPEVAKDFDAATWLFLELTNGKPLPVFEVVEALRHLKKSGNDINQPNNLLQRNVAHMLASYGRLKPDETTILMEEFLELGLDIYAPDFEGKSALDLAPSGGHIEVWEKRRNFAHGLEASLAHKVEKQEVQVSTKKRPGI